MSAAQIDMFAGAAQRIAAQCTGEPQDFGEKGKRAWFWQDGSWQVGKAWAVDELGRVAGMCRDYGPWGSSYPGAMPCETHGRWKPEDVSWKRPANQYERPAA